MKSKIVFWSPEKAKTMDISLAVREWLICETCDSTAIYKGLWDNQTEKYEVYFEVPAGELQPQGFERLRDKLPCKTFFSYYRNEAQLFEDPDLIVSELQVRISSQAMFDKTIFRLAEIKSIDGKVDVVGYITPAYVRKGLVRVNGLYGYNFQDENGNQKQILVNKDLGKDFESDVEITYLHRAGHPKTDLLTQEQEKIEF